MNYPGKYIIINQNTYTLSDLKDQNYSIENKTPFEAATLQFCADWLNGKESYTIHTSGSTGVPKPITVSADQMKASAKLTLKALCLKEGHTALVCLNTEYIAGMMMLVRALEGGLQIIAKEPSANPLLGLGHLKIDFAALVPLQLHNALQHPESTGLIKKISKIIVGGAPMTQALEATIRTFKNHVYHTYGMTETVSHIALRKLSGTTANEYYKVLEGIEIDADNRGCLMIRGAVTENVWLITNDLVKIMDKDKFLWKGRVDQVINSGGIKVQVEELEKKIDQVFLSLKIPNRFFIIGKPNDILGEEITLLVEGDYESRFLSDIQKACSAAFNKYENPKTIHFIPAFIETLTGKIHRKATLDLIKKE